MCGCHFIHALTHPAAAAEQVGQRQSVATGVELLRCHACGTILAPEFVWCPNCGVALKAHSCAYCRQTVSPGDKSCSYCGAPAT